MDSRPTYWQSVGRGIAIGAVALSGLVGAEVHRGTMDRNGWIGAAVALGLWSACTLAVVAARRWLRQRQGVDHTQQ